MIEVWLDLKTIILRISGALLDHDQNLVQVTIQFFHLIQTKLNDKIIFEGLTNSIKFASARAVLQEGLAKILKSDEALTTYITPDAQDWHGMALPKAEIFSDVYETFKGDMFIEIRFLKKDIVGNLNLLGGDLVFKGSK